MLRFVGGRADSRQGPCGRLRARQPSRHRTWTLPRTLTSLSPASWSVPTSACWKCGPSATPTRSAGRRSGSCSSCISRAGRRPASRLRRARPLAGRAGPYPAERVDRPLRAAPPRDGGLAAAARAAGGRDRNDRDMGIRNDRGDSPRRPLRRGAPHDRAAKGLRRGGGLRDGRWTRRGIRRRADHGRTGEPRRIPHDPQVSHPQNGFTREA